VLMCVEHVPIMWEVGIAMIALLCARFLRPKLAYEPRAWPFDSSYY
jgi:hypothetical protein